MPNVTPFLWFDHQAEEAANFYVSVFPNSKVTSVSRYPEGAPGMGGKVMTVGYELDGKPFTALNAGPHFKFTEAVSFVIHCKDQAEVDHYWSKLTADGGQESQCGWLKDKYGLSWQVTPDRLVELMTDPDKAKAGRVMAAMMQMVKIDIPTLEKAAAAG
jgi:predicted 3-demethylubiquinone-9 3-methyltransferase (glyoxalase superfamily)